MLGEHVHLDVHSVTALALAKCGDCGGVWNDGNTERITIDVECSQAHSIDGDGAFFYEQLGQLNGDAHPQVWRWRDDLAGGIHVSKDEMTAESFAEGHGTFEVDMIANTAIAECGA